MGGATALVSKERVSAPCWARHRAQTAARTSVWRALAAASTAQACMDWPSRQATSEVAAAVARWEYGATPAPTLVEQLAWLARPTTHARSISKTIVRAVFPPHSCNRTQAANLLSWQAARADFAPSIQPA